MTLDLSFKDLADVAEKGSGGAGSPLRIAIARIDEDPDQPRRVFSEQELDELSATIREHGVLQPILVRRSSQEGRYVIVMGARRYRAAQRAGLREIPAFLQEGGEPDRYAQMIENIQRDDLRAPEIAAFVAGRLDQIQAPAGTFEPSREVIDPEIAPAVHALNAAGIKTVFSCQGIDGLVVIENVELVVQRFHEPLAYVLCSAMSGDTASRLGEHPDISVHERPGAQLRLASPHPSRNQAFGQAVATLARLMALSHRDAEVSE